MEKSSASSVINTVKEEGNSVKLTKIIRQKQNMKDVAFNVKRNVPLGKIIVKYCQQMGYRENVFKFHYQQKRVGDLDTPDSLDMDDDEDVIDCWSDVYSVGGKTVGIVGLGRIGSGVAKRLHVFDCRILYNARNEKPSVPYKFYSDVREMAADSDLLVICCSLSDQTRHMINKDVLTALGKDGIIVNIARGPIIDEKELVTFLVEGRIAGAGLDVFEHEPRVPEELFSLDNVVLAHHQAGFTEDCFRDLFELVKGNFEAFFSNKPLLTPVV
ncbi:hypothetical protein RND81_14G019500 [Saponaria officinalis]|uniref:Uncharacterized protein n=1 Tax=Saponaria officinalis TaxID=3572 RepID=A0AAW1GP71_SAPOF